MRDPGIEEAIRAAGGVGALARMLGIAQPSVSNWGRVPAERVIAVEAATGVPRTVLRPDLYGLQPTGASTEDRIEDIEIARARQYGLLAVLLVRAPDADLLARLSTLRGDASLLGLAHAELAEAAAGADTDQVAREFSDLFIGIGRGELVPYASYYLTGFLHQRPLARIRADLEKLGIELADGQAEPEDHASLLCDVMAGLADRRFSAASGVDRDFFENHLAPWIGRFFADLEDARGAQFYRHVGRLGRVFVTIESEAFTLAAGERRAAWRAQ
jgi:TorA maturation chaperone TorD